MGKSEIIFGMISNEMYQLPPKPSRQEEFEYIVTNFIRDHEERVKQLKEYIKGIVGDFMQLSSEVARRLKEKMREDGNRMRKIKKIIKYPEIKVLEPLAGHKFLENLTKKTMSKRARITKGPSFASQKVSLEEKIWRFGVFDNGKHQMHHDTLTRRPIHFEDVYRELVREFFASFEFDASPCRYDPKHLGVKFRLGGEQREISLLELGWRVGLYTRRKSMENVTLNGLSRAETGKVPKEYEGKELDFVEPFPHVFKKKSLIAMGVVIELHNGACFWPATREVEEDDEAEKAAKEEEGNERTGGSAEIYPNMSQGDWQEERTNWMYDHTVCQFQHLSTRENLDPHIQIDPFPRREVDYPPFGYHGPMPPCYAY
ncbi:hypothetical protein Tco_1070255 [Tanacetum coccineum]|uniref:Uncharacterized protein n=1 Tax=Tanacetum coccineum TaxID=301880 RepID=A0ABQ5HN17_9ASTR